MPASMALRPVDVIWAPSCGSSTMTSGFCEMSASTAGRCSVTSLPAATGTKVTSLYFFAWALALAVMAAIQPWSAAGAEKPTLMALPGVVLSPWLSMVWFGLSSVSLPVQAVSSTPAPTADPTASSRRRDRALEVTLMRTPGEVNGVCSTWRPSTLDEHPVRGLVRAGRRLAGGGTSASSKRGDSELLH